jgi:GAF domain-containing protein
MGEGIALASVPRYTLLPEEARLARFDEALPQIRAALEGETDAVAIEATMACLLWETLVQTNWCGFYRRTAERLLTVGPYQGTMGCLRIDFARGACGACARTGEVQLIDDVHAFPGHIACDDRTRSELVVPVTHGGVLVAVVDLDSPHTRAFSRGEADRLQALVTDILGAPGVRF